MFDERKQAAHAALRSHDPGDDVTTSSWYQSGDEWYIQLSYDNYSIYFVVRFVTDSADVVKTYTTNW